LSRKFRKRQGVSTGRFEDSVVERPKTVLLRTVVATPFSIRMRFTTLSVDGLMVRGAGGVAHHEDLADLILGQNLGVSRHTD
jgi:hypothetical protein